VASSERFSTCEGRKRWMYHNPCSSRADANACYIHTPHNVVALHSGGCWRRIWEQSQCSQLHGCVGINIYLSHLLWCSSPLLGDGLAFRLLPQVYRSRLRLRLLCHPPLQLERFQRHTYRRPPRPHPLHAPFAFHLCNPPNIWAGPPWFSRTVAFSTAGSGEEGARRF